MGRAHPNLGLAIVAAVTLASPPHFALADASEPIVALSSAEACKMALSPRSYLGKTFFLSGSYLWDWEWGAFISFDGCEMPLAAPLNELVRQKTGTPSGAPL